MEEARSLLAWLESFGKWCDEVMQSEAWLSDLYRLLLGVTPSDAAVRTGLRQLCSEWTELLREGSDYVLRGIEVSGIEPGDAPFDAAIDALAAGRKPFGPLSIGKSKLKTAIEGVRVDSHAPADTQEWQTIRDYRRWQKRTHAFIGRWSSAARAISLPPLPGEWEQARHEFLRIGRLVEGLHEFHLEAEERITVIVALFPYGVDAKRVVHHGEVAIVREALGATVHQAHHTEVHALKRRINSIPCDGTLPFGAALEEVRSAIGDPDVSPRDLADSWRQILDEARRLAGLRPARERLETIASTVRASRARHGQLDLSPRLLMARTHGLCGSGRWPGSGLVPQGMFATSPTVVTRSRCRPGGLHLRMNSAGCSAKSSAFAPSWVYAAASRPRSRPL